MCCLMVADIIPLMWTKKSMLSICRWYGSVLCRVVYFVWGLEGIIKVTLIFLLYQFWVLCFQLYHLVYIILLFVFLCLELSTLLHNEPFSSWHFVCSVPLNLRELNSYSIFLWTCTYTTAILLLFTVNH